MGLSRQKKAKARQRRQARELERVTALETYVIHRAPKRMRIRDDDLSSVISFLANLRAAALYGPRPVLLDMSGCKSLSPIVCVLLAAEVERCITLRPGCITSDGRATGQVQYVLCIFGFHDLLGVEPPRPYGPEASVSRITSGGGPNWDATDNPSERTFAVANMATHVLGAKLANRVHSALNEATDNVIGHAYKYPDAIRVKDCIMGRWWVAGIGNQLTGEAYFFVYDQGATIPRTAPHTENEYVHRLWMSKLLNLPAEEIDRDMLLATVRQKRTVTLKDGRGKGLGHMIGLIDEVADGAIHIYSGNAYYIYTRSPEALEPQEFWGSLKCELPGTLIVWKIGRSEDGSDEHDADPAS